MTTLALRPATGVHVVDEGLLLAGREFAVLRCGRGLQRLWEQLAPAMRAGCDPDVEIARLPDRAGAALRQLIDTLHDREMLQPLPGTADSWLAATASAPAAAAEAVRQTAVAVTGAAGAAVTEALAGAGFRLAAGGAGVLVGSGPLTPDLAVAALRCGSGWLVANLRSTPPAVVSAAARRLGTDAQAVEADALLVAVTVDTVIEAVTGGGTPYRARIVDAAGARRVTLVPELRDRPRRLPAQALAGDWAARDDRTALDAADDWFAPEVGVFPTPLPGDLEQLPLALNRATLAGRTLIGAGPDHDSARVATALHVLRSYAAVDRSGTVVRAAGAGPVDFLADALGRLALRGPVVAARVRRRVERRSVRWVQGIAAATGEPPRVIVGRSSTVDGLWLAQARVTGRGARGYGADPAQAVEHALRALLALFVVPAESRPDVDTAHLPDVGTDLVGSSADWPALLERLRSEVPGLGLRLLEPADGFAATGLILGEAWLDSDSSDVKESDA